jgi:hypothetical protein
MAKSGSLGGPRKKPRSTDVSALPGPRPQPPRPANPLPAPPGPRVQQRRVNIPAKPDES